MTTRYRSLLVAALLCGLATAPACYTLLKHPRLASMDYGRPQGNRCGDCHSDEQIWSFNHAEVKSSRQGTGSWWKYYDVAWWYERSWDYTPPVGSETRPQKEEKDNSNS